MANVRDAKVRNYCESVYTELSAMKSKLLGFVKEIEQMTGPGKGELKSHIPHFRDMVNTIDWKLEILMKVCPSDWTGYAHDIESTASVRIQEEVPEKEQVSAGYIGG